MTIYYVKQDDSYVGCSEPGCCGESYEATEETFVKCGCGIPENEMTADHLQGCNGGGPVLKWRKAKKKEVQAFNDGESNIYYEAFEKGIEWQKKKADDEAMRLFKPVQDMTVRELTKLGYVVRLEGEAIGKPNSTHTYREE